MKRREERRRECLEVVGIPCSVDDNSLEENAIQVGCNIDSNNIGACHRITKKNDRGIVKFSMRKGCQRVLSVKNDLQKLEMEDIGLTGDNKVLFFHSKNKTDVMAAFFTDHSSLLFFLDLRKGKNRGKGF